MFDSFQWEWEAGENAIRFTYMTPRKDDSVAKNYYEVVILKPHIYPD